MIQMVQEKEKSTFFVSVLACEEVNSDSIILMKRLLVKCDRNKGKCKKIEEVQEMRKRVQDESV